MQKAMEAVSDEKLTVSAAAQHFYVPRKTLDDRMKRLVQHGNDPGPKTVLKQKMRHLFSTWNLFLPIKALNQSKQSGRF